MPLWVVGIIDKKAKAQRDSQRCSHPAVHLQSLSTQSPLDWLGVKRSVFSLCAVLEPPASKFPGALTEYAVPRVQPRPAESQYLGIGSGNLRGPQTSQVSLLDPRVCGSWAWAIGSTEMSLTGSESGNILDHNSCVMRKGKRNAKPALRPALPLTG